MPLTALQLNTAINWTLAKANTGFASSVDADPGQQFSLGGVNLATFSQILAVNYSIANAAHQDFDLFSFTNLVGEAAGFGANGVLALFILPVVGRVSLSPGSANPLTWFMGGAGPTIPIPAGSLFEYSLPPAGPGQTVDATHRILTLSNSSGAPAAGYFIAVGG